jgi:branched-subunit amino acid ABC-type transport system permease component
LQEVCALGITEARVSRNTQEVFGKKMKKILALVLCVSVLGVMAAGCSGGEKAAETPKTDGGAEKTEGEK